MLLQSAGYGVSTAENGFDALLQLRKTDPALIVSDLNMSRMSGFGPQTVSRVTRDLDEAVRQFHEASLQDEWAYLILDGVSLRVRRPSGRKRVQMLVAYGVRRDGTLQLLGFLRSQGGKPAGLGRAGPGSLSPWQQAEKAREEQKKREDKPPPQ